MGHGNLSRTRKPRVKCIFGQLQMKESGKDEWAGRGIGNWSVSTERAGLWETGEIKNA